jgi:hypothetical protein
MPMISLKDCLDYSDLTEEEVAVIAEHEHLPYPYAVELACGLTQTSEGEEVLRCLLGNAVCDARACHHAEALKAARHALKRFAIDHPKR